MINASKAGQDRGRQPPQFQMRNADTITASHPDDTTDVTPQTQSLPKVTDTAERFDETIPRGVTRIETIVIMRMTEGTVNATISTDMAHQETKIVGVKEHQRNQLQNTPQIERSKK